MELQARVELRPPMEPLLGSVRNPVVSVRTQALEAPWAERRLLGVLGVQAMLLLREACRRSFLLARGLPSLRLHPTRVSRRNAQA